MLKKFLSYFIPISMFILICLYTTSKVTYKTFSRNTSVNNNISMVNNEQHIADNSTLKNTDNNVEESKKASILAEDKKNLSTKSSQKIEVKTKKIKYEYKDYFQKLKELEFYKEDVKDENVNFRNAVLKFQSSQNILVDGIIGPDTMNLLMNENKQVVDTLPENFPLGYCVVINKDNRILTIYHNKSIYKKYPIAIGRDPSFTPTGRFNLLTKLVDPAWCNSKTGDIIAGGIPENPLGKRWLGLSIGGGSTYGIHGNNNPWSIGTNASLGCIRMINNDVVELFDYLPINSPIWIGDTQTLNSWQIIQK